MLMDSVTHANRRHPPPPEWQLIAVSILYATLHCFDTAKAIVRILLRGEAWSAGDFPAFYATAAASYRLGVTPYIHETVQAATNIPSSFATTYPPFSILMFAPYTFVDITTAFTIHSVLNFISASFIFFFLYKKFLSQIENRYIFIAVLGLLFWESISSSQNFLRGQTNILIAALIAMAWQSLSTATKTVTAGVAIGVAALIKVYFVLLLVPLFFVEARSAIIGMGAILFAATISFLFFPSVGWHDWWNLIVPAGALGQNVPGAEYAGSTLNHSLNGLLARNVVDPFLVKAIGYPLILIVLGFTAYALLHLRRHPKQLAVDAGVPLLLTAIFLVSPLSWVANYIYLWMALVAALEVRRRTNNLGLPITLWHVFLLVIFCLPWHEFTFGKYEKLFGIIPTTGALILWVFNIMLVFRIKNQPSPCGSN